MARIETVFLDRDGVINRKPPEGAYVTRWEEFEFLPGVLDALRMLRNAGVRIVVVTNQRGVATNRMRRADVDDIHDRMLAEIERAGAAVEAVLVCPHDEGMCDCRKPRSGLFRQAQTLFPEIDLSTSIVVGDSLSDIEAGNRIGCRTFLVGDVSRREAVAASGLRIDGGADSLLGVVRNLVVRDD